MDRYIHGDPSFIRSYDALKVREDAKFLNVLVKQKKEIDFDFDYTLNPYQGCSYGCKECYVQDIIPSSIEKKGGWGNFVEIRRRTIEVLEKYKEKLKNKRIFVSTLSDLWMPEAFASGLTRAVLEKLETIDFYLCVLSTRSTFVLKDIDILKKMSDKIEIGISIPTDRSDIIKLLHPRVATPAARFSATKKLRENGLTVRVQMAPCLPSSDQFAKLVEESADWLLLDYCSHQALPYKQILQDNGFGYCLNKQWTESQYNLFKSVLGEKKVKLGEEYFAWKYDE
jgi:DNA repair photolyase